MDRKCLGEKEEDLGELPITVSQNSKILSYPLAVFNDSRICISLIFETLGKINLLEPSVLDIADLPSASNMMFDIYYPFLYTNCFYWCC